MGFRVPKEDADPRSTEEGGRVLWDATSRGLCGRIGPRRINVHAAWQTVRERAERKDRDGRAGGATMLQPLMLRLTRNAAAFAAARPTLLFKPW